MVIHRMIYGSLERFTGILLEHTARVMPPWVAPRHVAVLPVANDYELVAEVRAFEFASAGRRSNVIGATHGTLGARRWAWMIRYPYLLVLGGGKAVGREPAVEL